MNLRYALNRGLHHGGYIGAALSLLTLVTPVVGMGALALNPAAGLLAMGVNFIASTLIGAGIGAAVFTASHAVVNLTPGLREALHEPDYSGRKASLSVQIQDVDTTQPKRKKSRSFDNDKAPLAGDYFIQVVENQGVLGGAQDRELGQG